MRLAYWIFQIEGCRLLKNANFVYHHGAKLFMKCFIPIHSVIFSRFRNQDCKDIIEIMWSTQTFG